jgi:hypothetical protein
MAGPGGSIPPGPLSSAREPVSRILFYAVIPLGAASPRTLISDLPGGSGTCSSRLATPGRHGARALALGCAHPSLFGLAPCGVYPATGITAGAVRSYRTFSPLPLHWTTPKSCPTQWRFIFCGTCRPRAFTPASRTLSGTLPCGVRTFLSRRTRLRAPPAATARPSCQG